MPHRRAADPIEILRGRIETLIEQIKALEAQPIRSEISLQLLRRQFEDAEDRLAAHRADRHIPAPLVDAVRRAARGRWQALRLRIQGRDIHVVVGGDGNPFESGASLVYDHLNQVTGAPGTNRYFLDRYRRDHLPAPLGGYSAPGGHTVLAHDLRRPDVAQVARLLRRGRSPLALATVPLLLGWRILREIGIGPVAAAGATGSVATAVIAAAVYVGPMPGATRLPPTSAPKSVDASYMVPPPSPTKAPAKHPRRTRSRVPAAAHRVPLPAMPVAPATARPEPPATSSPAPAPATPTPAPPAVAPPPTVNGTAEPSASPGMTGQTAHVHRPHHPRPPGSIRSRRTIS